MGKIVLAPVAIDLEELLHPCVHQIKKLYQQHGVSFKNDFRNLYDFVSIDPLRIQQVASSALLGPLHLLDKSKVVRSCIEMVAVDSAGTHPIAYYVQFTYHIIGLPNADELQETIEALFEPFNHDNSKHLVWSNVSNQNVLHLGFAIAHDLTKLMGGTVSALKGFKLVTLKFEIPVGICSTAQIHSQVKRLSDSSDISTRRLSNLSMPCQSILRKLGDDHGELTVARKTVRIATHNDILPVTLRHGPQVVKQMPSPSLLSFSSACPPSGVFRHLVTNPLQSDAESPGESSKLPDTSSSQEIRESEAKFNTHL
ncbi:UNVERIFIED_CONTAM: hypothetical protein HDU68_003087 [Siphonaria sp. JEL0065]|nr:hypothetical protein HDU68_003087 [Siphonaria sp. JEL0065]